ncbi:MAG: glnP [Proteobacteria bacterium]|nr:glnP [Pseudomonadota bacterium]
MSISLDFSLLLREEYSQAILKGIATMFELTALAWLLAAAVGTMLAIVRMSNSRLGQAAVAAYVEVHQNVPMLVLIFLWYFGVPGLLPDEMQRWINAHNSEFLFAFIGIGLCMAAYISEGLRSGIRSIPKSQLEASRALGLSYLQSFRLVVLPQAVRLALPTLVSHSVLLFKNTSLAMAIGAAELTYVTREIESQSFRTVEVYLFSTLAYLAVSLLIMGGGAALEHRYRIKGR